MARRRYGRKRGRHSFKLPILTVAILGGQALAAKAAGGNDWMETLNVFQRYYTGFDLTAPGQGQFRADQLLIGWGPWIAKGLVGKVARGFGRPKVPFGLPISIS